MYCSLIFKIKYFIFNLLRVTVWISRNQFFLKHFLFCFLFFKNEHTYDNTVSKILDSRFLCNELPFLYNLTNISPHNSHSLMVTLLLDVASSNTLVDDSCILKTIEFLVFILLIRISLTFTGQNKWNTCKWLFIAQSPHCFLSEWLRKWIRAFLKQIHIFISVT